MLSIDRGRSWWEIVFDSAGVVALVTIVLTPIVGRFIRPKPASQSDDPDDLVAPTAR